MGEAAPRPHVLYKRDLAARIAALSPASVLDVGCGAGELLRAQDLAGCARLTGLEVDAEAVARLSAAGLDVRQGVAEALPFGDRSFDVVVMEYVAHHLADLPRGLAEAARVARRAVIVLDPWYDLAWASQRVALAFDGWCKAVDRAAGDVHNPCPSAAELAAPFAAAGGFAFDYAQRLVLQPIAFDALAAVADRQLARLAHPAALAAELAPILEQARRDGVTEDGAILFTALRTDGKALPLA